ncbi:MAG: hypothetical protein JXA00_06750 [Candidatus Thermoplasmatota archaeon]|nr:hypothetical protein [Candidatus Thermoplasmatota archaeon]
MKNRVISLKRFVTIFFVIFTTTIFLLSVTAVPTTNAQPLKENKQKIKKLLEKTEKIKDSILFKKIQTFNNKHGSEEKQQEIYQKMYTFYSSIIKNNLTITIDIDYLISLLSDVVLIAASITYFVMILFGLNPIAWGLGVILSTIVLMPLLLLADFGYSFNIVDTFAYDNLWIDITEMVNNFGIIGGFIILVLWIPFIAVVYVVGTGLLCIIDFPCTILTFWELLTEYPW